MRVLMIITSYHPIVGGAEKQLAQVARLMVAQGHQVTVLTRHHRGLVREEMVDGIRVRRIAVRGPKPLAAAMFVLRAAAAARAERADVIHCHSLFSPALAGALGKLLSGAPLFAKPMCGGEASTIAAKPLGALRISLLRRITDRFIAISGEIEAELRSLAIPAENIARIPNGVDLARFKPAATAAARRQLRRALDLPDGTLFVFAGRVAAQKRLPLLLGAWQRAVAGRPEALLLIAGANRKAAAGESVGGENDDTVPEALLRHPNVRLLGNVDDMPQLLAAADAFVLPSSREGLSNALLEACAAGLPVIAARIGGAEDFITSGLNGLLFTVDDEADLTRNLTLLLNDPEARARLGAAARATMQERYDITVTAANLLREYAATRSAKGAR